MSELFAVRWSDIDWEGQTMMIQRGIVRGHVGEVKNEASEEPVPLDPAVAELLLRWRGITEFAKDADWVFASPFQGGEMPYWSQSIHQKRIEPAAKRVGVWVPKFGWHSFRHSYRSWLSDTGAAPDVVQKLMRHADLRTTFRTVRR